MLFVCVQAHISRAASIPMVSGESKKASAFYLPWVLYFSINTIFLHAYGFFPLNNGPHTKTRRRFVIPLLSEQVHSRYTLLGCCTPRRSGGQRLFFYKIREKDATAAPLAAARLAAIEFQYLLNSATVPLRWKNLRVPAPWGEQTKNYARSAHLSSISQVAPSISGCGSAFYCRVRAAIESCEFVLYQTSA